MTFSIPSACILGTQRIPSQITILGVIGGPRRFLLIDIDAAQPRQTFRHQALVEMNRRLIAWRGIVPFYGEPDGFVVNYDCSRAVRFDLEGRAIELLRDPVFPGSIEMSLSRSKNTRYLYTT